jgi:hypothetical protein
VHEGRWFPSVWSVVGRREDAEERREESEENEAMKLLESPECLGL